MVKMMSRRFIDDRMLFESDEGETEISKLAIKEFKDIITKNDLLKVGSTNYFILNLGNNTIMCEKVLKAEINSNYKEVSIVTMPVFLQTVKRKNSPFLFLRVKKGDNIKTTKLKCQIDPKIAEKPDTLFKFIKSRFNVVDMSTIDYNINELSKIIESRNKEIAKQMKTTSNNQNIDTDDEIEEVYISEQSSFMCISQDVVNQIVIDDKAPEKPIKIKPSNKMVRLWSQTLVGDDLARLFHQLRKKLELNIVSARQAYIKDKNGYEYNLLDMLMDLINNAFNNRSSEGIDIPDVIYDNYLDEVMKDLQVFPQEILSPIELVNNPALDGNITMAQALADHYVDTGSSNKRATIDDLKKVLKDAKIIFPLSSSYPIVDAILLIPYRKMYKQLGISVKAGALGRGAPAALSGTGQSIFNYDSFHMTKSGSVKLTSQDVTTISDLKSKLTEQLSPLGRKMYNENPNIMLLISGIMLNKPSNHLTFAKNYVKEVYRKPVSSMTDFVNQINESSEFHSFVLRMLQAMATDIIQLNVTPKRVGKKLFFKTTGQYPAVFEGKCKLYNVNNTLKFCLEAPK